MVAFAADIVLPIAGDSPPLPDSLACRWHTFRCSRLRLCRCQELCAASVFRETSMQSAQKYSSWTTLKLAHGALLASTMIRDSKCTALLDRQLNVVCRCSLYLKIHLLIRNRPVQVKNTRKRIRGSPMTTAKVQHYWFLMDYGGASSSGSLLPMLGSTYHKNWSCPIQLSTTSSNHIFGECSLAGWSCSTISLHCSGRDWPLRVYSELSKIYQNLSSRFAWTVKTCNKKNYWRVLFLTSLLGYQPFPRPKPLLLVPAED